MPIRSSSHRTAKPVLLDMDVGADDAVALCLALRSPEINVVGITAVHGNVGVRQAAANTLRTLDVLEGATEIPVAMGAAAPLRRVGVHAQEVHGEDGFGGATELRSEDGRLVYPRSRRSLDTRTASRLILDQVGEYGDRLTLVATGPLTNVAAAIADDAARMLECLGVVAMTGAFRRPGNASPVAEFNAFVDPDALDVVLRSGVPVTLIPLDVTEQVVLAREVVERHSQSRLGRFLRDVTCEVMDFGERVEGIDGMYVHDALAVASVLDPTLFGVLNRHVAVETTAALTLGQTVGDMREPPRFAEPPNADVAVEVDRERLLALLVDRAFGD